MKTVSSGNTEDMRWILSVCIQQPTPTTNSAGLLFGSGKSDKRIQCSFICVCVHVCVCVATVYKYTSLLAEHMEE